MVSALLLLAGLMVGCGKSGQDGSDQDDARAEAEAQEMGFEGRRAEAFASARETCGGQPRSEFGLARGFSADAAPAALARRYGAEWPRPLRGAAVAGCQSGLATAPARFPPSSPAAGVLWGRQFVAVSVGEGAADEEPPVGRPLEILLSFSAERDHNVGWHARCNGASGDLQITDTLLKIEEFGSTLIGCDPEREGEDEWLASFMLSEPEWRFDRNRLRIESDLGTMELEPYEASKWASRCPLGPSGGWVDLGTSGIDCDAAVEIVALLAKDRLPSGWRCRDAAATESQSRVVCRRGTRTFVIEEFDPASSALG